MAAGTGADPPDPQEEGPARDARPLRPLLRGPDRRVMRGGPPTGPTTPRSRTRRSRGSTASTRPPGHPDADWAEAAAAMVHALPNPVLVQRYSAVRGGHRQEVTKGCYVASTVGVRERRGDDGTLVGYACERPHPHRRDPRAAGRWPVTESGRRRTRSVRPPEAPGRPFAGGPCPRRMTGLHPRVGACPARPQWRRYGRSSSP